MRTTITLDPDIAARLERLRQPRGGSFKRLVNEALRAGLDILESPPAHLAMPYHLKPVFLGARLPDLDNVAEVLAAIEGEVLK